MDNKISGCSYYGISMYQSSPYIIGNELYDNGMALLCEQYSSPYLGYADTYGNNYIHNNSIGLFANFSSNPFLGRTGCIAFGGANSFVNQTSYHIEALNYCEILAENNWWYPLTAGKFYSYNSNIDYEPYLESPPFNNMNNMKNSPEESVFDSKFAQRGFDSKVATEEKALGFQNDWCIKWKLLYARNLIEIKKYKQAQKICKDVIEEYPDSSLTHYAVDLLWQASRRGDNDSLKGFFKKLSNKKAKKKLYASAEKILAGFERNLRIENLAAPMCFIRVDQIKNIFPNPNQKYSFVRSLTGTSIHELGHARGDINGHDGHGGANEDVCVMHTNRPIDWDTNPVFCDNHIFILLSVIW